MDSTVTALIGIGATVVVGVAGFGAAIWNTRQTIAHAREERVWDRRAEVYVETLAAIQYRQAARQKLLHPESPKIRQRVDAILATYKPPDWPGLEARLQAFASEPVFTAVQATSTAQRDFHHASQWSWHEQIAPAIPLPMETDDAAALARSKAQQALEKAWKAADDADDVVVERIRTELQGKGHPLGDWQAFAATDPPPGPPH